MTYTTDEKKSLISDLILMALVDNELRKEEIAFIKAVGGRMELSETELLEMMEHPEKLNVVTPKNFTKRIVHFHRLMLMMHIDGTVDERELQLLNEIALKYGFRKTIVDSLLATMLQYPHGEIPPTELLQIHSSSNN